jgi:hypothetical protein
MSENTEHKFYTDQGMEYQPMLGVGDWIEFDFFGQLKKGEIEIVGKYGYWINSGGMGCGSIRCPFGKERQVACA